MIYDLQNYRRDALARTKASLKDMIGVLRNTSCDAPQRYLIENIVARLKEKAARLAGPKSPNNRKRPAQWKRARNRNPDDLFEKINHAAPRAE